MKKIKVLYIIDYLESTGGAEKRALNDLSLINSEKFDLSVVCLYSVEEKLLSKLNKLGVKFFLAKKNGLFKKFLCVKKVIAEVKPDIVHSQLFYSDILGRTAAKLCKVPIIISTFQNSVHEPGVPFYYIRHRRVLDMITARFCTHFVAVSEFVKKSVSRRLFLDKEKISVIYNYISGEKQFKKSKQNSEIRLSCVGKLVPPKGQGELIQAIKLLVDDGIKINLFIVGDGPFRKKYEELTYKLKIQNNIIFLGNTTNVGELIVQSDAFVFPTHSEGLPLSLLEAVLAKVPCIISSIPPNLEVISEKNCFTFKPKNSKAIYIAVKNFISTYKCHPDEISNKTRNAFKFTKKKYDPEMNCENLQKLYKKLMSEVQ